MVQKICIEERLGGIKGYLLDETKLRCRSDTCFCLGVRGHVNRSGTGGSWLS